MEPSPDASAIVKALQAQDQAVENAGYRLATANADLCPDARPDPAILVQTIDQYRPVYRAAAVRILGLGAWPGVTDVVPGSPAESAGLRAGDALTAVNTTPMPHILAPAHDADFTHTQSARQLLIDGFAHGSAVLSVQRGDQALAFDISATPACIGLFEVVTDDEINGEADGLHVKVSSRLVALTTDDDELAAALAHELAHNILHHRVRLDSEHVSRGLLSQFGRNAAHIRETEIEADRMGIYLLARAGFSPDKAMAFWRRLSTRVWTFGDATHPGWKNRLALMQTEVDRIKAQGAVGRAITLPEDLARLIPQPGL